MFNRFWLVILSGLLISLIGLVLNWQDVSGIALHSNTPVTKAHRISQDLGGKWDRYPSLRKAWTQESRRLQEDQNSVVSGLIQVDSIVLPSAQEFKVAVKRFKVTGKWGFKTAQLVIEGAYGKARVYLNGIDEVNYLGEFEGAGGTYAIDISPTRFDYSEDNTLYIEMTSGRIARSKLLGWIQPEQGRITGPIRLEAVSETTLDAAKTAVAYDTGSKNLNVNIGLKHHQTLEHGPWAIHGILKDGDQKVAECLLPLTPNGSYEQTVKLTFGLPDPKYWSLDKPNLYQLDLTLTNSKGDFDSIQMPIGIKKSSNTTEKWLINEKEIMARGEILTPAQSYLLRNQRGFDDYLKSLKAKGANVVYCMGFFPDEGWLYSADRIGMGMWIETPLTLLAKGKISLLPELEELIIISERHPSVLAWTAAKGLEPSLEAEEFIKDFKARIPDLPVYHVQLFPHPENGKGAEHILLGNQGLSGGWGEVSYNQELVPAGKIIQNEENERLAKTAAIAWLVWLIFVGIQNFRAPDWNFRELFNQNPKRAVRRAFFWRCLSLFSRMATLGAILTSLLFRISPQQFSWLSYSFSWLEALRNQPPLLLWAFISTALMFIRLFQVGLASSSFPQNPGAQRLCCWLERRYSWTIMVGAAWLASVYGLFWYLPLAVYIVFSLLFFPLRVKDVWKAGGKYYPFMTIPFTLGCIMLLALYWNIGDFLYLYDLVRAQLILWLSAGVPAI